MTEDQERKILEGLRAVGSHEDVACSLAGVPYGEYQAKLALDPAFKLRVRNARAAAIAGGLAQLRLAGSERKHELDARGRRPPRARVSDRGDWRAIEAWLRLIEPTRFAARLEVTEGEVERLRSEVFHEFVCALEAAKLEPDVQRRIALALVDPAGAAEVVQEASEPDSAVLTLPPASLVEDGVLGPP